MNYPRHRYGGEHRGGGDVPRLDSTAVGSIPALGLVFVRIKRTQEDT